MAKVGLLSVDPFFMNNIYQLVVQVQWLGLTRASFAEGCCVKFHSTFFYINLVNYLCFSTVSGNLELFTQILLESFNYSLKTWLKGSQVCSY